MAYKKPKGWRKEPARHSLAARGIKTGKKKAPAKKRQFRTTFYGKTRHSFPLLENVPHSELAMHTRIAGKPIMGWAQRGKNNAVVFTKDDRHGVIGASNEVLPVYDKGVKGARENKWLAPLELWRVDVEGDEHVYVRRGKEEEYVGNLLINKDAEEKARKKARGKNMFEANVDYP